ncbi:MAG TPA: FAD-dependent oxidoreductase [Acidimicrobiales bacterium]|nr:FAD-dependent oxidoreductase [Acidimicrobiales bacterium]
MTDTARSQASGPAPDVIVVGGGLAGLAAATTAARAGARTTLLDAHPLGGRARVDRVGGYLFNRGPRAVYVGGRTEQVLQDLGVDPRRGAPPRLRGGAALRDGRLHLLPRGPGTLLRTTLLGPGEKARFARRLATVGRLDPAAFAGTSTDDALAGLGLGPVGRQVVTGLVRVATYTAATDVLDGAAAVAQLQAAATTGVRYLDGGWQPLVDGLAAAARAAGVDVRPGVPARAVEPDGDGAVVVTGDGTRLGAGSVVVAAGGPEAAAALLRRRPDGWSTLGPPVAAACLELGLRRPPATPFVMGVDEPLYLSTHAPPADLAPEGGAVVHVMRYLHHDEEPAPEATRARLRALATLAGVADADVVEERFLARMLVSGGLPAATGGGLAGRPAVDGAGPPGVLLAGDWVGPEGLLADAALASAVEAGRRAAARSGTLAPA